MSDIEPNTEAAVEFLQKFSPSGPWALTAIVPDGKTFTQTFRPPSLDKMKEWIASHQGLRNIYFHVNPVVRDLNNKAQKTDISQLAWLHVDIDPRPGEDPAEEKVRALRKLREFSPAPTVIIDSGGGVQGFWRLREAVPTEGDLRRCEELEAYNIQLERLFEADACHNIDRVMRLPGTINIPNARKLKKGRKPALATVVEFNDYEYPLSLFTAAPIVQVGGSGLAGKAKISVSGNVPRLSGPEDLDQWNVPDYVKMLIVQGSDPDDPTKYGSRSEALFRVCCELVRCSVPNETIYAVITDPDFGISASVIDKPRPEAYALRQIEQAQEFAIDPALKEMNEKHAVIADIGGRCRIISEVYDPAMKRAKVSRQSFEDFRNRYRHEKVQVGEKDGQPVMKKKGDWWIDHPKRRQYETIIFAPGHEVIEAYNLWKGFAYEPRPGDCSLYLEHLRNNICRGSEERFRYLEQWMARAVQHPDAPGEVAVVLRGKRGTGKGVAVKIFGSLFGRHYMQVSDPKHLVGAFNAHLRDCVVLFGDEAFFAGDKKHESVLKTLITEEYITIEAKGVDVEAAPNYVHMLLSSNNDWVVPAGAEERRFFALDVSDEEMQNTSYFKKLIHQMDNGGKEALLHYLLTMNLEDFEVRKVPQTEALRDQKMLSFSAEESWWFDKLYQGRLLETHQNWEGEVRSSLIYEDYTASLQKIGQYRKLPATALGRFLQKVAPGEYPRLVQRYEEINVATDNGYMVKKMSRPYYYIFPNLDVMRSKFDAEFGGPFDWPVIPDEAPTTPKNTSNIPF